MHSLFGALCLGLHPSFGNFSKLGVKFLQVRVAFEAAGNGLEIVLYNSFAL